MADLFSETSVNNRSTCLTTLFPVWTRPQAHNLKVTNQSRPSVRQMPIRAPATRLPKYNKYLNPEYFACVRLAQKRVNAKSTLCVPLEKSGTFLFVRVVFSRKGLRGSYRSGWQTARCHFRRAEYNSTELT